jgi:succinate dehydrogenase hydrophobic anchor subunit
VADFMLLFLGLSHGLLGIKNIIDDRVHSRNSRLFWLSFLSLLFTVFLVAGTAVLWTIDTSGGN